MKGTLKLVNTVAIQLLQSFVNVTFFLIGSLFRRTQLKVNWVGMWTASPPLPLMFPGMSPVPIKLPCFPYVIWMWGLHSLPSTGISPLLPVPFYWGNSESLRHGDRGYAQRWYAKHLLPPLYSPQWENQMLNKNWRLCFCLLAATLRSDLAGITGCHLVYKLTIYFPSSTKGPDRLKNNQPISFVFY